MSQELFERVSKAKIKLMIKKGQAFLSSLVLGLEVKFDEKTETATTNGLDLTFNPEYVKGLSDPELLYIVAKLTWHVAFMHMLRRGNRDPKKWVVACEYAINYHLRKANFQFVSGALEDSKYDNMSAEEIYELLPDEPPESQMPDALSEPSAGDGNGEGEGQSSSGGSQQGPSKEEIQQKVEDAIIKAAQSAEMQGDAGSVPGSIERMKDEFLNPKLPWQVILSNFMTAKSKTDKSWSRRNKRFRNVYLPSKLGESMGNVNIYVDASGSVSQAEFSAYITEMQDIRENLKPELMKVVAFDTSIKEEFVMEKGEDIDVNFRGGGGTSIECVIEHAEEEETDVTIIFTDGYFSDRDYNRVPNDVIWVIVNNPSWTCPVGEVIHMEFNANDN
jgi:predicted metal-dependent peptidase